MGGGEILLLGHGTVENLDDLPPFLANIRRKRPAPPELLIEIRRRYEAIGGSPLLRISRELTTAVERRLGSRVHLAMRFWHPFVKDVLSAIASAGCRDLRVVPLAPYSGAVYAAEMRALVEAARAAGEATPALRCAPSWGEEPALVAGFAASLRAALEALPADRRRDAHVFFTAHSLPLAVVRQGDPYPADVQRTADAVAQASGIANAWRVVYQSQGATADPWLGPTVHESLQSAASEGVRDVVVCPIGFLSDHIEVLYDLDIEALKQGAELGITLTRTASLNATAPLVDAICAVATRLDAPA